MRTRIQRTVMAVALFMLVAIGFPMLIFNINTTRSHVEELLRFEARALALHANHEVAHGETPVADSLQPFVSNDVHAKVWVNGTKVFESGQDSPESFIQADAKVGYVSVHLTQPSVVLTGAVANALLVGFALAALASLIAWRLSEYVSTRVERPLAEFALAAERMGTGDARPMTRRYGLPELDQVAEVLDRSAQRIQQLIDIERRLTSEVSHQLRSPLTALSLQIEEIRALADSPEDVRREIDVAARQVDRLTQVMEELVHLRRSESIALQPINLSQALTSVISESRRALRARNRSLSVTIPTDIEVKAAPGGVRNILAILLENAAEHGRGTVVVAARKTRSWVVLSVSDAGPGVDPEIGQSLLRGDTSKIEPGKRRSIGLPLAATLAAFQDGRLEWLPSDPAVFRLYMRSADEDPAAVADESKERSEPNSDDVRGDVIRNSAGQP